MRHRASPPDDLLRVAAEAERALARLGPGVDPAVALAVWNEANVRRRQREDHRLLIKIAVANALLQVGLRLSQPTPTEPEQAVEPPPPTAIHGDTFDGFPCAQGNGATGTRGHGDVLGQLPQPDDPEERPPPS